MPTAVIASLRAASGSMTPALARVAEHVLAHAQTVLYQSITELAEEAGASEASVMRFCRELGFTGYQNFKLALAQELATQAQADAPVTAADAVQTLIETAKLALDETERLLDRTLLASIAQAVLAARQIEIFGVAASAVTAHYLEYKLVRLGLRARAVADAHLASMIAATADAGIVHILVSSSGSTIDAVRVAELARGRGAQVISITNRSKSPLVAASDQSLLASWPETPLTGGAFPSKISQLLIVDALVAAILGIAPERATNIQDTASSVSDRNY